MNLDDFTAEDRARRAEVARKVAEALGPAGRAARAKAGATARWSGTRHRWALDTPAGIVGSWRTWAEGRQAASALRAKYKAEGVRARVKLVKIETVG